MSANLACSLDQCYTVETCTYINERTGTNQSTGLIAETYLSHCVVADQRRQLAFQKSEIVMINISALYQAKSAPIKFGT